MQDTCTPIYNKAYTPDNPCFSLNIYAASLRWSTMSITPIDYGDIVLVRFVEYIVGILCQIAGGSIWVNVIGCVCSTLFKNHSVDERFEEHTDLLNMVMKDTRTPIYNKACTPDNPCFSLTSTPPPATGAP